MDPGSRRPVALVVGREDTLHLKAKLALRRTGGEQADRQTAGTGGEVSKAGLLEVAVP